MSRNSIKFSTFTFIICYLNFLFFHIPFFRFILDNITIFSFNGSLLIVSLFLMMIIANYFVFYLFLYINKIFGKIILSIFFTLNSVCLYFINTYSVIIDESMIGNVFNTNYSESSSYFTIMLLFYIFFLGIIPTYFIYRAKISTVKPKTFLKTIGSLLLIIFLFVIGNAGNWLWIDKHSKVLGGLALPWSYTINTIRYFSHKAKENKKEILLPNATLKNNDKAVMILVIGESARRENFSLFGYQKNTNPLLSQTTNLYHFPANACATYTTEALKCILEHQRTNELYEILPNYLHRNNVDVIWRTANWGEPPVHIEKYQSSTELKANCKGEGCNYDEILLYKLKEEITSSKKEKILIVLHTNTSHEPNYSEKYPARFGKFTPVCNTVELGNCSKEALINAYDNSILYTDYLLNEIITLLKDLKEFESSMIYVSDHGESLGEKNLYMHSVPMSIAPQEQIEIPFIVWNSNSDLKLKDNKQLSHGHVFHSVLNFLAVESPIYNDKLNIYDK